MPPSFSHAKSARHPHFAQIQFLSTMVANDPPFLPSPEPLAKKLYILKEGTSVPPTVLDLLGIINAF